METDLNIPERSNNTERMDTFKQILYDEQT